MSVTKTQASERRSKKHKSKPGKVDWIGFIEVRLTAREQEQLESMEIDIEYPYELVDELLAHGYKVSFSKEPEQETYRVTLMDVDSASPSAGNAISGRGATVRDAFASVMFKHLVILADGWEAYSATKKAARFD